MAGLLKSFRLSLISAFEKTYGSVSYNDKDKIERRVISKEEPLSSALDMFLGLNTKFFRVVTPGTIASGYKHDANKYNWFEQFFLLGLPLLGLPRVAKNTLKLATEFLPNALTNCSMDLMLYFFKKATELSARADRYAVTTPAQAFAYAGRMALAFVAGVLAVASALAFGAFWLTSKITQSITSPFAAMKESYYAFSRNEAGRKRGVLFRALGFLAAVTRGLIALAAYSAIAAFAAPVLLGALAASGTVGAVIAGGLGQAVTWVASLPVVGAIGSTLAGGFAAAGSYLGLGLGTSLATAAAAAAVSTLIAAPVLAALRIFVRKLFATKENHGGYNVYERPAKRDIHGTFADLNSKKIARLEPNPPAHVLERGSQAAPSGSSARMKLFDYSTVHPALQTKPILPFTHKKRGHGK